MSAIHDAAEQTRRVREAMLAAGLPIDAIREAADVMEKHKIRRLPVLDRANLTPSGRLPCGRLVTRVGARQWG